MCRVKPVIFRVQISGDVVSSIAFGGDVVELLEVYVVEEAMDGEFGSQLLEVGFGAPLAFDVVDGSGVVHVEGNCVVGKVGGEGLEGK